MPGRSVFPLALRLQKICMYQKQSEQIIIINISMYDSNRPSNKKRNFHDETALGPTAQRSQYRDYPDTLIHKTPTKLDYLSPARSGDRLSQARKSINQAIELMSGKKSMNRQALEEIKNVNQEILHHLSDYNPSKNNYERGNRTADHHSRHDSRDFVATSQFEWPGQEELNRSQKESALSTENVELRSRLNEEMKRNNNLIKKIQYLENQNSSLKNSQGYGSNIAEENRYLRSQLANSQGQVPIDLLQELRKLKEENQLLRRDTIALLKNKQY